MRIQDRHLDFAAQLMFFLTLIGFAFVAFMGGGVDFRGYYAAATLVIRGGNPYDYTQLAPVLNEITGFWGNNPYFYPPWFCLFLMPLTVLPYQIARAVWLLINVGLFYLSLEYLRDALGWKVDGWRQWGGFFGAVVMFAAYCLKSEQVGILLLFGLALILRAMKQDRPALGGLGLIIMATKPQTTFFTIVFLGLWLFFRKPSAVLWAGGGLIVLIILASTAIPRWWELEGTDFGQGLVYQLNGPDRIVSKRVNSTVYDFFSYVFHIGPPLQYAMATGLGLLGVGLVGFVWYRFNDPAALISASTILTLLVTPYALQYDYVPLTVALFWIFARMSSLEPMTRFFVAVILLLSFSVLVWQEWSYQGYWQLLGILVAFWIVVVNQTDG